MLKLALSALIMMAVLGGGAAGTAWLSDTGSTAAEAEEPGYPFTTLSPDFLSGQGLKAQRWGGTTDGLLDEAGIRQTASRYGTVGEMILVQLTQGNPGEFGFTQLDGEAAAGPVWAVVYADKPYLKEASAKASEFVNVRFFSPQSGESLFGFQGAIVQE